MESAKKLWSLTEAGAPIRRKLSPGFTIALLPVRVSNYRRHTANLLANHLAVLQTSDIIRPSFVKWYENEIKD